MTQQTVTNPIITREHLAKSLTYTQYCELFDKLLAENKTTGTNHSPDIVEYTRMNLYRMLDMEKAVVLDDELVQILLSVQTKMIWLVLTEAWCGDAAQNLPGFVKISDASPLIELKFILRDENPDVMEAYLTNGGRSIPKLIALDADTLEEIGTWGPRPVPAQKLYDELKMQELPFQEFSDKLHSWYDKDCSKTLQNEFKLLLRKWAKLEDPQEQAVERF
jgi:hypothetical protein